jgi:ABC-2 type transport system permease protein
LESAIFGQAMREYLRPKRLLPWLALSGLCFLLALVWVQLDPSSKPDGRYATVSSILVFRLLALASAIFTTAIITQEVEQRTIVYLLTRPVPRWKLLLIRYAASVLVVAMIGIIGAVLATLGAYRGLGSNPVLANDILALFVGAVAYGALFLFVSLLFNRSLIICALFAFGWESSIPNMPGEMYRLSIFSYLQAIAEHPSQGNNKALSLLSGSAGDNVITRTGAFTTLGVLIVIALGLSAWWFTRFEYVPREDAE